jgi:hypothetical protein
MGPVSHIHICARTSSAGDELLLRQVSDEQPRRQRHELIELS